MYKRLLVSLSWLLVGACSSNNNPTFPDRSILSDMGTMPGGDGANLSDMMATTSGDMIAGPTVIRVHYPAGSGHTIAIRGGAAPLNWTTGAPATVGADDTWTFTTSALTQITEWKPLLDDATWSRGPNYHVGPGQTLDVYPHFTTIHGTVGILIQSFNSTILNNSRTIRSYLPPSYNENTRATYPVLYMHDGQNLFDPSTAFGGNEWMVDESCDFAAETGLCSDGTTMCANDGDCANAGSWCTTFPEPIVIGIDNDANRIWEYTPTRDATVMDGGGGDLYLKMILSELKPQVDQMLRTRPDVAHTALVGSSLGGLISAYAGTTHPEVFGLIGAMSPSTWWDNLVIIGDVQATAGMMPRPVRVYVDSGDSGTDNDDVTDTNMLAQTYAGIGYTEGIDLHHVVQAGGQHNEIYWAQRFPGAARFLLGARP